MGDSKSSMAARVMTLALVPVRIAIGWHFLYEGWVKIIDPGWTAAGYLKATTGPLIGLFNWMASNAAIMRVVDVLNAWGLCLIGLALMLGVGVRIASWAGAALLAMYYVAMPPLWTPYNGPNEGTYLLVNKNLVELCALVALALVPTPGLPWSRWFRRSEKPKEIGPIPRRQLIAELAGLPVLGGFVLALLKKHGWTSFDAMQAPRKVTVGRSAFVSGATFQVKVSSVSEVQGVLPQASIGKLTMSRVIMGGNLMAGFAHARDLLYVDRLVKAYHTRDKIYETVYLGERCGINAIVVNPMLSEVFANYHRLGGRMQFITNCGSKDLLALAKRSVDNGAASVYIHGGEADRAVRDGRVDWIGETLEGIRKLGVPAGIGGHKLATIRACVDAGLKPDYWVKTLHRVDYWSARPEEVDKDPNFSRDNNWCERPEDVIAYMRERPEPWIAFKVLAAGAIKPRAGLRYAFENGADFVCLGMYDFQVVEDVNHALWALNGLVRTREWRA